MSDKYDRQLRLWASTGQTNLENSHVCLVNASVSGSELLKNLILPGVGKYSIIDNTIVNEDDLSGNFFLDDSDIGRSKAQAMCDSLSTLNEDSSGVGILDDVANQTPSWWDQFNLVVVSDYVDSETFLTVIEVLWKKSIPILVMRSWGFYGSVNLIVPEVAVIDTHSTSRGFDLRIDHPWNQLVEYCDSIDLNTLDDTEHAHIPYVVIFIKALAKWREHHQIDPQNYREKKLFAKYVEAMSRNINFEANFIQATNSVHRAIQKTEVPGSLISLFNSPQSMSPDSIFWLLVKTLKNFVKSHDNCLPLLGTLPDMVSDTENYIKLQSLYKAKAAQDRTDFIHEYEALTGRSVTPMDVEYITLFCKNCLALHVTKGSKQLTSPSLMAQLEEEPVVIYYGLMMVQKFIDVYKTLPSIDNLDAFIALFVEIYSHKPSDVVMNVFKQILSHPTSSYHNTASLIGGVGSQEALKLLTSQYIPLDNVFIYDGVHSITNRYKI